MNPFKRIILWDYSRGTWQYDVLCLLIIAFIFLTPKTWFDRREKLATQTTLMTVKSEDFSPGQNEDRMQKLIGERNAEIIKFNGSTSEAGGRSYDAETSLD